jgi:hypothetical protein
VVALEERQTIPDIKIVISGVLVVLAQSFVFFKKKRIAKCLLALKRNRYVRFLSSTQTG